MARGSKGDLRFEISTIHDSPRRGVGFVSGVGGYSQCYICSVIFIRLSLPTSTAVGNFIQGFVSCCPTSYPAYPACEYACLAYSAGMRACRDTRPNTSGYKDLQGSTPLASLCAHAIAVGRASHVHRWVSLTGGVCRATTVASSRPMIALTLT